MLQSTLSDAQTPRDTWKLYFDWVFNTFQACQWLWFPGLCDQHLWEQRTMPSISDVKSVRMGANCSCCFCICFIISVLPSLLFLIAAKTFPKRWNEWWVASCGSQLYHMNDWSIRNVSALTVGSLHLKDWAIQYNRPSSLSYHCVWDFAWTVKSRTFTWHFLLLLPLGQSCAWVICINHTLLAWNELWSCRIRTDERSSV